MMFGKNFEKDAFVDRKMRNISLTTEEDELLLTERERRRRRLEQGLLCTTILIGVSGAAALSSGVYAYRELRLVENVATVTVFSAASFLLALCGTCTILSAIYLAFSERERALCTLSYSVTLVSVLQCVVAALCIAWRTEIGKFLVDDLKQLEPSALDHIQSAFRCCGVEDRTSNNTLPDSCCQNMPCDGSYHIQGCLSVVQGRYESQFAIMGYLSLSLAVFQFACFHTTNYLVMRME